MIRYLRCLALGLLLPLAACEFDSSGGNDVGYKASGEVAAAQVVSSYGPCDIASSKAVNRWAGGKVKVVNRPGQRTEDFGSASWQTCVYGGNGSTYQIGTVSEAPESDVVFDDIIRFYGGDAGHTHTIIYVQNRGFDKSLSEYHAQILLIVRDGDGKTIGAIVKCDNTIVVNASNRPVEIDAMSVVLKEELAKICSNLA